MCTMMRSTALLAVAVLRCVDAQAVSVVFRNEMDVDVDLLWAHPSSGERHAVGTVAAYGGELQQDTHAGHVFTYDDGPDVTIRRDRPVYALSRGGKVRVECEIEGGRLKAGKTAAIGITVYPDWAPRGAGRFLELVRRKVLDGVAMNRVVPNFLAQFGIPADHDAATFWRSNSIPDDPKQTIPFDAGYIAFAGSGPDSRSSEMFFVMPDTPKHQLEHFGTNPWETPFAVVDPHHVREVLHKLINEYGDMPPWGEGPDPQKIYRKGGYAYLERDFPGLAYFTTCAVREAPFSPSRDL